MIFGADTKLVEGQLYIIQFNSVQFIIILCCIYSQAANYRYSTKTNKYNQNSNKQIK
jgi:hypothetical protein